MHISERCPPGYFSSTGLTPCQACPRGFYQENIGSNACKQCNGYETTESKGAVSKQACASKWVWLSI